MNCRLLILLGCFVSCLDFVLTSSQNDYYEVAGVPCAANEEVSCLIVKCPTGRYCPAENFCYNPKCVCRQGYRKAKNGLCVEKHLKHNLGTEALNSALLKTHFD